MPKIKRLPLIALGLLSACQGELKPTPSPDPAAGAPLVGALHISAQVPDPSVDRVEYTVLSSVRRPDLTGTLAVADGLTQGQIQVPEGTPFDIQLRFLSGNVERCEGRAKALAVESGRTSQVNILPLCGQAELNAAPNAARNRAPRIEAVFASRRNVRFGEEVAVSVAASDQDGDRLRYQWAESIVGSGFEDARAAATSWKAGPRSIARNTLRVTVNDGRNGSASASLDMTFEPLVLTPGTCEAPTPIRIGDTIRGFTTGSPSQHVPSGCLSAPSPEHVFELELSERQDVSISLAGSAFFPQLYVRREVCESPEAEVACDQERKRIELLDAEPGTYFLFVDGVNLFNQGEYTLSVFSGVAPEVCNNNIDDDEDTLIDCADSDCEGQVGCATCAFECDTDPNDCVVGQCDRFSGRCNVFLNNGGPCDSDGDPQTLQFCTPEGKCVLAECGNGIVELDERCDDGNTVNGDGCENCQTVGICGNGWLEFPEQCDDGNTVNGDGCEADCRLNGACGDTNCNDFNPCTADRCLDESTATCESLPVADGTSCDSDGLPETPEQCQAGFCSQPPADNALIILAPAVLDDPAFSLRAMHNRLAADGDGALLFEQWATTLTVSTTINGHVVEPRSGFAAFLNGLPSDASGRLDLDRAGFLPSAFVNRFDLRTPGNCGENGLVFTTVGTNVNERMTIMFAFNVPDDGSDCRNAVARWTALRSLQGDALRSASANLVEQVALPLQLKTMRTNEFISEPSWELREFRMIDAQLTPAAVVDSVPFELAQDPTFRAFVIQNASALNQGARESGLIPEQFLAGASAATGNSLFLGNIVPTLPGLDANINIRTCSGCHLTHTGTTFMHVSERSAERPSQLSAFLRGELEFRTRTLDTFLTQ